MSGPNGLSERILILGDEAKSARSIQRLLAAAGYDAISAPSFESAQQELAARDISIIIIETSASRLTDTFLLTADDDSGESLRRLHWAHLALNFCEEVRAAETTADVPILVISKSHRAQDKVVCLNQGATDYITRPYQRAELLSRVRAHLRSSRYERERNERFEQLNVLHTVSSVLASSLEPEVLMQGTLTAIMKYVRACSGVVFLREADERPMTVAAAEGLFLTDAAHEWEATRS
jgi:DNA-binding response OmpR family regulator